MKKPFRERFSFLIILGLMVLIGLYALQSREVFALPLFIYVVLLGADVAFVSLSGLKKAVNAKKWPEAPARLLAAEAVKRRSHKNAYKWFLEVAYEYTIAKETYASRKYNWVGAASTDKSKMDRLVQDLRESVTLKARYNPWEPSESVIIPEISPIYLVGMVIGSALMFVGSAGILEHFGLVSLEPLAALMSDQGR